MRTLKVTTRWFYLINRINFEVKIYSQAAKSRSGFRSEADARNNAEQELDIILDGELDRLGKLIARIKLLNDALKSI